MLNYVNRNENIKLLSIGFVFIYSITMLCKLVIDIDVLPINEIAFVLGWIIIILLNLDKKEKQTYPAILVAFIISITISTIFNFNLLTIKSSLYEIFYMFVIYNIAKECFQEKDYIKLVKIVLIGTFIITTIFFIEYIILLVKTGIPNKKTIYDLVFNNINGGALLVLLNIIMIMYMYKIKKIKSIIAILGMLYYTIFIIISHSRTSLLSLFVLIIYVIYNHFIKIKGYVKLEKIVKMTLKVMTVIIVVTIIIFALGLIINTYERNYKTDIAVTEFEQQLGRTTALRYWLWKNSIIELIEVNPFFGIKADMGEECLKNMDTNLINIFSEAQIKVLSRNNLHNGYIQILVQNGILGFIIIMIFFNSHLKKVYKTDDQVIYHNYIKYLYLFYIIINLFENDIILSQSIFVLLLWINIGMDSRILEEKMTIEEEK